MNGISFGDIHSYYDLNLVLSKVEIPPARAKSNFVDIPGGDGSVDLTEALGEVKYKDRECTFTFTAFPEDNFEEKKREISNLINGKRCKIVVDKDPEYYWQGRCFVNKYKSDRLAHTIVIQATVSPYKLCHELTKVIVQAGESVVKKLNNARKTAIPTITNTEETTIKFGEYTITLEPGTHRDPNIALVEGVNVVHVTSGAEVQFVWQEGDL